MLLLMLQVDVLWCEAAAHIECIKISCSSAHHTTLATAADGVWRAAADSRVPLQQHAARGGGHLRRAHRHHAAQQGRVSARGARYGQDVPLQAAGEVVITHRLMLCFVMVWYVLLQMLCSLARGACHGHVVPLPAAGEAAYLNHSRIQLKQLAPLKRGGMTLLPRCNSVNGCQLLAQC
jgi:hypothetical protein